MGFFSTLFKPLEEIFGAYRTSLSRPSLSQNKVLAAKPRHNGVQRGDHCKVTAEDVFTEA
jgi:hypothetical protein